VTLAWRPFKDAHVGGAPDPAPDELPPLLTSTFEKSEYRNFIRTDWMFRVKVPGTPLAQFTAMILPCKL